MPTAKRPASVRPISSARKKPRFSNTTSKDHKPVASQKLKQVVDHDDSASEEELQDEKDQDAQPSTGHTLGPLGGNTLSIQ
jgi:hypothetical protein